MDKTKDKSTKRLNSGDSNIKSQKSFRSKKEENIVTVLSQNIDPPIELIICILSFSKITIRTSFRSEFESYDGLINDFWTPQPQD